MNDGRRRQSPSASHWPAARRADIARHVKELGEEAKAAPWTNRPEARKQFVARGRGPERVLQEVTDAAVESIEKAGVGEDGGSRSEIGRPDPRFFNDVVLPPVIRAGVPTGGKWRRALAHSCGNLRYRGGVQVRSRLASHILPILLPEPSQDAVE
jgi:hypothetical protein